MPWIMQEERDYWMFALLNKHKRTLALVGVTVTLSLSKSESLHYKRLLGLHIDSRMLKQAYFSMTFKIMSVTLNSFQGLFLPSKSP